MDQIIHYKKGQEALCGLPSSMLSKRQYHVTCRLCRDIKQWDTPKVFSMPKPMTKTYDVIKRAKAQVIPAQTKVDVYQDHINGESLQDLSDKYYLTIAQVRKIIENKSHENNIQANDNI